MLSALVSRNQQHISEMHSINIINEWMGEKGSQTVMRKWRGCFSNSPLISYKQALQRISVCAFIQ